LGRFEVIPIRLNSALYRLQMLHRNGSIASDNLHMFTEKGR
jgi:hypothetical protein